MFNSFIFNTITTNFCFPYKGVVRYIAHFSDLLTFLTRDKRSKSDQKFISKCKFNILAQMLLLKIEIWKGSNVEPNIGKVD